MRAGTQLATRVGLGVFHPEAGFAAGVLWEDPQCQGSGSTVSGPSSAVVCPALGCPPVHSDQGSGCGRRGGGVTTHVHVRDGGEAPAGGPLLDGGHPGLQRHTLGGPGWLGGRDDLLGFICNGSGTVSTGVPVGPGVVRKVPTCLLREESFSRASDMAHACFSRKHGHQDPAPQTACGQEGEETLPIATQPPRPCDSRALLSSH